jgi:hypothetical protein
MVDQVEGTCYKDGVCPPNCVARRDAIESLLDYKNTTSDGLDYKGQEQYRLGLGGKKAAKGARERQKPILAREIVRRATPATCARRL